MTAIDKLANFETGKAFNHSLTDPSQTNDANGAAAYILTKDLVKTDLPFTPVIGKIV